MSKRKTPYEIDHSLHELKHRIDNGLVNFENSNNGNLEHNFKKRINNKGIAESLWIKNCKSQELSF